MFDNNNHISGSSISYDAVGNIIGDGTHTYAYDAEERLVCVDYNGSTCQTASYQYDAEGHRAGSTVGTTSYEYVYDAQNHVSVKFQTTPSRTWVRDELYAGNWHLGTYVGGSTEFIHSDWLGTVRARTGPTGALINDFGSLPFGDCLTAVSPCDNGIGDVATHFTDQDRDTETGLDHFLFRQYSSLQGHWTTPDPGGLAVVDPTNPQTWNRYAYVANNPVNALDPLGENLRAGFDPCSVYACDVPGTGGGGGGGSAGGGGICAGDTLGIECGGGSNGFGSDPGFVASGNGMSSSSIDGFCPAAGCSVTNSGHLPGPSQFFNSGLQQYLTQVAVSISEFNPYSDGYYDYLLSTAVTFAPFKPNRPIGTQPKPPTPPKPPKPPKPPNPPNPNPQSLNSSALQLFTIENTTAFWNFVIP